MPVMRCTVIFRDGKHRTIEAEVYASSLFEAVELALAASRLERQVTPPPETEFSITEPNGEERIVRFSSLVRYLGSSASSKDRQREWFRSALRAKAA